MATVNIKLTQAMINKFKELEDKSDQQTSGTFSDFIGTIFDLQENIANKYNNENSWSKKNNKLSLSYGDDVTATYAGSFTPSSTGSGYEYGTAKITNKTLTVPNTFTETYTGNVKYDYSVVNGALTFNMNSGTISSYRVTTDSSLDNDYGSMTLSYTSKMKIDSSLNLTGTISNITETADKFLKSQVISGDFSASTSLNPSSLQNSTISGTVQKIEQTFYDGSHLTIDNANFHLSGDSSIKISDLSGNANLWSSNDTFDIQLPDTLFKTYTLNAGKGNDTITIKGGGGKFSVDAGEGNDTITLLDNAPTISLGVGKDLLIIKSTSGKASISDFNTKDDTIQLENAIFTKLTQLGKLSSANFITNTTGTAKDQDDYVIYNSKTGIISYDADGSGAGKAIEIALIGNKAKLTVSDFVVI